MRAQELGNWGEVIARKEYQKQGFTIFGSNIFNRKGKRFGEIDIVAFNKTHVVFVEVKTRTSEVGVFGTPADAVGFTKQQRILKAVKLFLLQYPRFQDLQPQIDVCIVIGNVVDKQPEKVIILTNAIEDMN